MRISIFIDGNNFYFGLKKIYEDRKNLSNFNFEKFCNFLVGSDDIVDIFYYNAPLDRTQNLKKYKKQQRFFWKLKKIPKFNLVLCSLLKRRISGTDKFYYVLKEDDIHMAVDLVKGAFNDRYDKAIIVSGDGDFVPAVKAAQEKNKIIFNACFKRSASTNLKKNCDGLIKLNEKVLGEFF
ncbi:MAG: NYN domain-containing protein [archaeon]